MGLLCLFFGHRWDCYKCQKCGKMRKKEQHDWDGGKCVKCGMPKRDFDLKIKVFKTMIIIALTYNDCVKFGFSCTDGYGVRGEIQMIREEYGSEGIDRLLEAVRDKNEDNLHFVSFVNESWPELFENCGSVDS